MICEFKLDCQEKKPTIVVVAFWSTPLPPLAAVGPNERKSSPGPPKAGIWGSGGGNARDGNTGLEEKEKHEL